MSGSSKLSAPRRGTLTAPPTRGLGLKKPGSGLSPPP
jgi:hypothetical protein